MEIKKYEHEIHEGLHTWAEEHADANPDIFVTLDIDPVTYPYQAVGIRKISGNPLNPDDIDRIAFDLDERYSGISRSISTDTPIVSSMTPPTVSTNPIRGSNESVNGKGGAYP